tara:strand:- start:192 stop:629 length:438 start_codon:yes stop_codon:yes gene_type:complete
MSLQEPSRKMSKTDNNTNATIFLLDDENIIRKKVMSAVTDSSTVIELSDNKEGIANLLNIYAAFSGSNPEKIVLEYKSKGYRDLKKDLADCIIEHLRPVRSKYSELIKDRTYLESVLKDGAANAQKCAYKTLRKVYKKVGFPSTI